MSKLPIPEAALSQHMIALGKTRSGKSSKVRVVVEYLLDHKKPVTILDVKGDWWGLKSAADGKHSGYPIVIFGGKHADVPLNPKAGAQVAELTATGNRPSLIDLRGWMPGDRTRFFVDFAAKTFELTQGERYLVMPEAHNFAPKGKVFSPEAGQMLHWANRLASEGQGLGLILLADSQRPQKVHNDFLTSCETLIACRVVHKADRDAIKDWIDGNADPAIGKQLLTSLAGMQRADAWVWSPEIDFGPEQITWPLFRTYDSFKPQPAHAAKLTGWADVDLDEVRSRLASVVAEAEASDPKKLKERIRELERAKPTANVDPRVIDESRAAGFENGYLTAKKEGFSNERGSLADRLQQLRGDIDLLVETVQKQLRHERDTGKGFTSAKPAQNIQKVFTQAPTAPVRSRRESNDLTDLQPVQARILDALAELEGMGARQPDRAIVVFMSGYSNATSKGFANAIGGLKTAGLVDYPGNGSIVLTSAGRQMASPPATPRTPEELQQRLIAMLGGASGRVLKPLIERYPNSMPRGDLAIAAGYGNVTSKGFANAIGKLSGLGFISYPERGQVAAKPVLFLEGA